MHGKLLSSLTHWDSLFVHEKSFSTGDFVSNRRRADRFTLDNSRQGSYTLVDVHMASRKILALFCGYVISAKKDERILFSDRYLAGNHAFSHAQHPGKYISDSLQNVKHTISCKICWKNSVRNTMLYFTVKLFSFQQNDVLYIREGA